MVDLICLWNAGILRTLTDSGYLIIRLLNTRQCCSWRCFDMHMMDAAQRWIVLVQLSVSNFHESCRMQVFACVSECLHAFLVGP